MFWTFDENIGDKTPMFLLVIEQCLHRAKDFPASLAALPERRLGIHKNLGGDTARTADPGWPKRFHTTW